MVAKGLLGLHSRRTPSHQPKRTHRLNGDPRHIGLPCLAAVGNDTANHAEPLYTRVGEYPGGSPLSQRRSGRWEKGLCEEGLRTGTAFGMLVN